MNFSIKKLPKSEIELQVSVPADDFGAVLKRALRAIAEEVEIPGFRKGKAPEAMVKEKVGDAGILERAAELAVRETYPKVLREVIDSESKGPGKEFTPIGQPEVSITKLASGNPLEYKVKFAVLPEVKLPDYKSIASQISKNKRETPVSDEEIAKSLAWLQNSRATLITVSREAAFGDQLEVDFEVRHGGVKIEGGESKNHPFILGQGKFVPGFEDALIGMKAGEEKTFTLSVPSDWHDKSAAGRALDFKVKVNLVQDRVLPELTDEFVKNLGGFDSLDACKKNIREGLESEKKDKERQRVRSEMISGIAKKMDAEVPALLLENELVKMSEELKSGVAQMGMEWEDYLLHIKKSEDELRREWQEEAGRRVKIALCLREIANHEKIEPSREEIDVRANEYLRQFRSVEDAAKKMDPGSLREYARGILRNEKVFEFLEGV